MNNRTLGQYIDYIEVSFLVYATEDMDRLLQMIKSMVHKENFEDLEFVIDKMRGYYGNPITKVTTVIRNRLIALEIVLKIANSLKLKEKEILKSEINHHIDDRGTFYIRLDKQAIFKSDICLGTSDPIRMKIKLSNKIRDHKEATRLYREFGFLGES